MEEERQMQQRAQEREMIEPVVELRYFSFTKKPAIRRESLRIVDFRQNSMTKHLVDNWRGIPACYYLEEQASIPRKLTRRLHAHAVTFAKQGRDANIREPLSPDTEHAPKQIERIALSSFSPRRDRRVSLIT